MQVVGGTIVPELPVQLQVKIRDLTPLGENRQSGSGVISDLSMKIGTQVRCVCHSFTS